MSSFDSIRLVLRNFFINKPVLKAWIFGSYARGEQNPDSDLDILVEFDKENYPSLLAHAAMICDLEEILKIKIDLVPREMVLEPIKNFIEHEKILIYESA